MVSSNRSVVFDIADTTTATGRIFFCSTMISAATRMRSALPMLVPPNFMIRRFFILRSYQTQGSHCHRLLQHAVLRERQHRGEGGPLPTASKADEGAGWVYRKRRNIPAVRCPYGSRQGNVFLHIRNVERRDIR